jgi:hypothetical protein
MKCLLKRYSLKHYVISSIGQWLSLPIGNSMRRLGCRDEEIIVSEEGEFRSALEVFDGAE